ncbi:hypothetical protein TrVE_jg10478 [Triparma verrucosa]|uniref:Uncharacterized protein n=1 Tax=Triparma verrucosa TaxID=1606542 RepID=A0A9W7F9E7_9STRA|nr:hypothetical protein TrVE_jg10478 [Triparma verrucosa]
MGQCSSSAEIKPGADSGVQKEKYKVENEGGEGGGEETQHAAQVHAGEEGAGGEIIEPEKVDGTATKTPVTSDISVPQIFCGSFNINGSPFHAVDVEAWLVEHGATDCDLVCLSFQECGTCGNGGLPFPDGSCSGMDESNKADKLRLGAQDQVDLNKHDEFKFMNVILEALNVDGRTYEVVADVSIGEPPTSQKVEIDGKKVEWYGFIRSIVFVNTQNQGRLPPPEELKVKTLVCPVGEKLSMFEPHKYEDAAPDKGAVGVCIESLGLLLVSLHLSGTNKYGLPEMHFDRDRKQQLHRISKDFEEQVGGAEAYAKLKKVVMGDYNFRCEMKSAPEDKEKGGGDWKAVDAEVMSGDSARVQTAFFKYDRLQRWMVGQGEWPRHEDSHPGEEKVEGDDVGEGAFAAPDLLKNSVDAITTETTIVKGKVVDRSDFPVPSFTFKIGEPPPRAFAQKRTPSWTDRIVVGKEFEVEGFGIERTVVVSDHEPVWAKVKVVGGGGGGGVAQ